MGRDEALLRLQALGFAPGDAATLADHFLDADARGKPSHGTARIAWLEGFERLEPAARPVKLLEGEGFELWDGGGALGYLTLAAICDELVARPPQRARVVAAARCFPTGMLGHWVRRLANAGLASLLTATSPARLAHPAGGRPLVGTNPLAIGLPGDDDEPIVVDVSMGRVTHGDVVRGAARPEDLVPFGGEQAHKAFALALGLQGWVESFVGDEHGAVLVAARPAHHGFVTRMRNLAAGLRLPGDA